MDSTPYGEQIPKTLEINVDFLLQILKLSAPLLIKELGSLLSITQITC